MPSPDGKYAASEFIDYSAQTVDIILFGLGDQRPARLTFVNYWAGCPIWSPDSHRLLFTQWRDYLDVVPITGGTADKVPFPGGTNSDFPLSWAPNGQDLLFLRNTQATRTDMWILPMSGDHKPHPYLNAPVNESEGRISPDGRWVAYTTDESGRNEVFVQSFPVPGNRGAYPLLVAQAQCGEATGGNYSSLPKIMPSWRQESRLLRIRWNSPRQCVFLRIRPYLWAANKLADLLMRPLLTACVFSSSFPCRTTGPKVSTTSATGNRSQIIH